MPGVTQPPLPGALYRAELVRALDRFAIEQCAIPGITLMERAGTRAFQLLRERWPDARRVAVLCGVGNNGGDGYVVARLARQAGLDVVVETVGDATRLTGDARTAAEAARSAGVSIRAFELGALPPGDLSVDALLGTGLDRPVSGEYRAAIAAMNASTTPVFAVDIPSGLDADTGAVMGVAVEADATVTFIGLKQGMFTGDGPDHCGEILFSDLDVPAAVYTAVAPSATRLRRMNPWPTPRRRASHKGHYGHVLVIGGELGYAGAARMAAEAAGRVGAGLLSVATRVAHAHALGAGRPEIMCHGVEEPADLGPLLARANVIAVGPGMGQSPWAVRLLSRALDLDRPMVLDADALNLLAADPIRKASWVLTPHPGEAGRLLGCHTAEVQADRFSAVKALQRRYGGVCVLKGAGTVIADGSGRVAVCDRGNPGMASGGMGDLLTGVIAGFLAQGLGLFDAACLGVYVHASAGDLAARDGERGLLATDLMPWIHKLANPRLEAP